MVKEGQADLIRSAELVKRRWEGRQGKGKGKQRWGGAAGNTLLTVRITSGLFPSMYCQYGVVKLQLLER